MEYATRHLYFPYIHKHLGECVYEENTSDRWHVHSIAYIYSILPKLVGNSVNTSFP